MTKNKDKSETEADIVDQDIESQEAEVQEQKQAINSASEINLAKLSDQELADMQQQIEAQKVDNHLDAEKQKIKDIKCLSCGKKLGINPDYYLKEGNIPELIECPKCEMLCTVLIAYNDDPSIVESLITINSQGYAWETQAPSLWADKHVKRWAQEESDKMDVNQSTLSLEGQKLFQCLRLTMKKQKLIK